MRMDTQLTLTGTVKLLSSINATTHSLDVSGILYDLSLPRSQMKKSLLLHVQRQPNLKRGLHRRS